MKHNWENYFDISSEYWKKVEKIYEESEHFPKIIVKDRNLHHKFPRSFSKKDGDAIDNDLDNLVSLSLSDHFLVHYYLWKCANKGYRGMMALAFNFMRKKMIKYASEETIEQLAKDYETAMKEAAKAISKANKGRPSPNKGRPSPNKGKHPSEEARKRNSEAHKGKHHSVESKNKIGIASKGRTPYNKGVHMSNEQKRKISEALKRKPKSIEHINKIAETNRGKHWYHNDKENFYCYECPSGCEPGMLKRK